MSTLAGRDECMAYACLLDIFMRLIKSSFYKWKYEFGVFTSACELEDVVGACCTAQSTWTGGAAGVACSDCMPARSRYMTSSCSRSSLRCRSSVSLSIAILLSSNANILSSASLWKATKDDVISFRADFISSALVIVLFSVFSVWGTSFNRVFTPRSSYALNYAVQTLNIYTTFFANT